MLEVKDGDLRKLSLVGRWEGSSRDHPVAQLSGEWRTVIGALRESTNHGEVRTLSVMSRGNDLECGERRDG